jgi:hypothetical protein
MRWLRGRVSRRQMTKGRERPNPSGCGYYDDDAVDDDDLILK